MKLHPDMLIHKNGDEEILIATGELSKTFHKVLKLNSTAALIVHWLEEERSEEELLKLFIEEYPDEDPTRLKLDLSEILDQLNSLHVLI